MRIAQWMRKTPLWFAVPSVVVAGAIGAVVSAYEPLVFDPALYEPQTADAAELATIDAAEIEAQHQEEADPAAVAQASASEVSHAGLADGSWTGYAACGQGNPDGWKPYYVGVTVEIAGGAVKGISKIFGSSSGNAGDPALSWDAAENQSYLTWAVDGRNGERGVKAQISAAGGTPQSVDTVSKATYSSVAVYNAYVDALKKAAAAAGADSSALADTKPAAVSSDDAKGKKGEPEKVTADTSAEVGDLADGTWTGYAQCGPDPDDEWKAYYVGVTVTVAGGKVASIDDIVGTSVGDEGSETLDWDEAENKSYLDWAINGRTRSGTTYKGVKQQLESALASGSNAEQVDAVSQATFSSKAIFNAYYAALAKSAAAAGKEISAPSQGAASAESPSAADGSGSGGTSASEPGDASGTDDPGEGFPVAGDYRDGTYTGFALCDSDDTWRSYYVLVDVVVSGGRVTSLQNIRGDADGSINSQYRYIAAENGTYLDRAIKGKGRRLGVLKQIQDRLDAKKNIPGIDAVSNATISSNAIFEAFKNAAESALPAPADDDPGASEGNEGNEGNEDDEGDEGSNGPAAPDEAHSDTAAPSAEPEASAQNPAAPADGS